MLKIRIIVLLGLVPFVFTRGFSTSSCKIERHVAFVTPPSKSNRVTKLVGVGTPTHPEYAIAASTTSLQATSEEKESSPRNKLSNKRREQMGIDDDDDYDVSYAISANTDSTITKVVAGSLIVVVIALLVVAVVIPSFQDYGGECNPLLTAGRC